MAPSQILTLVPDFSGCERETLARHFWQLLRICVQQPDLREKFRVHGPRSGHVQVPAGGLAVPLSDGYVLIYNPDDAPVSDPAGSGSGLEVVSVGARELTVKKAPKPSGAPRLDMTVLADPEHIFAPLWDVSANQLYCYVTRLLWNAPDGHRVTEQSLESLGVSVEQLVAVDLDAAARTVETVRRASEAFGAGAFAIPVRPKVLNSAASQWHKEIWNLVLPVLDQIVFEVILDRDAPADGRIEAAVSVLESFGRPILLRAGSDLSALGWMSRLPVAAVGFDGGTLAQESAKIPEFKEFRAVNENGMASYVLGLTAVAPTAAAITAGFAFIGSDAISPSSHCEAANAATDDPAALLRTLIAQRSAATGT